MGRNGRKGTSRQKGLQFEEAVAAMQRLLDPDASVTHNEVLVDRLGHRRQFDVVLRGKLGGHDVLGVIECKDYSRPVGTPDVNAFADKAHNVRANLSMLASRTGFTKPALELAAHHGIGTFSLLREDLAQDGFSVGVPWYAELYAWTSISAEVFFHKWQPTQLFQVDQIYVGQQNLIEWVMVQLHTTYVHTHASGVCTLTIRFPEPRSILIGGYPFEATRIVIRAVRSYEQRWKHVLLVGKAIYNWGTGQLVLPKACTLESQPFQPDVSDWELFDGDIPAPDNLRLLEAVLTLDQNPGELPRIVSDIAIGAEITFELPGNESSSR